MITMDELPHSSGSTLHSSMDVTNGLLYHTTTIKSLPADSDPASSSSGSSRTGSGSGSRPSGRTPTTPKPRLPQRPSFSRRQRFNTTYTQLASHMALLQATPHKPKKPSPLHISVSPESLESELSSSSSEESSPEVGDIGGKVLSPIREEKDPGLANMLGLDLRGWSWSCEREERMKDPRTPFPTPALLV